MFVLAFHFPAGRYHATPWGRNVNEADVAWPPEPWRILRALIATWWRKGERDRWSEDDLSALIDALAKQPPIYRLPDRAVHAHTRHYMPAPLKTTLVFDAFARLPADSEIIVAWPELTLSKALFALATDLAGGIGYLGRAESWVECTTRSEWDITAANCLPYEADRADGEAVCVIAPRTPPDYAAERNRLFAEFDERERQNAIIRGNREPSAKALATARTKAFGATLPNRLVDALTLDTRDYQRLGWSRPPASREVVYVRQPLTPTLRTPQRGGSVPDDRARFTVARFVLAGRPRPRIEDAVKIGELMRLAVLAQFGWTKDETTGRWRPNAPDVISGRDADNQPLRDPEHRHAFWLPEDADGDGEIDHIVVYAAAGFNRDVRLKLDKLTRLWVEPANRSAADGHGDFVAEARKEWRLALEGFGTPADFHDASALLRPSKNWESVTPFLAAGHIKGEGHPAEVRRILARRQSLIRIDEGQLSVKVLCETMIHGRARRPVHFHRFRSRGRENQPDALGVFLRLHFAAPVEGPLALGYACHFGLGMFRSQS
jgi:CRISPR-associated protein Csb2